MPATGTTFQLTVGPWSNVGPWFNTARPVQVRGKVALLHAFQMLCPMCADVATPFMNRVHGRLQDRDEVEVIRLHTVFENHGAMGPDALIGYLARAGIRFPVAVDQHDGTDDAPITMRRLLLMGTPSIVTVDRQGQVRERLFGVPTEDWGMKQVQRLAGSQRA